MDTARGIPRSLAPFFQEYNLDDLDPDRAAAGREKPVSLRTSVSNLNQTTLVPAGVPRPGKRP